jgi:hypothetical protein
MLLRQLVEQFAGQGQSAQGPDNRGKRHWIVKGKDWQITSGSTDS